MSNTGDLLLSVLRCQVHTEISVVHGPIQRSRSCMGCFAIERKNSEILALVLVSNAPFDVALSLPLFTKNGQDVR